MDDRFTNGYVYLKLKNLGSFSLSAGASVETAEVPAGLLPPRDSGIGPAEVEILQADPAKAAKELGWTPRVPFDELVAMMVDSDLQRLGGAA